MKAGRLIFLLFLFCSSIFVFGSIMKMPFLVTGANIFIVPLLLLLYWIRASRIFYPIVLALFLFYIRDIFICLGPDKYPSIMIFCLLLGLILLLFCAVSMLRRTRIEPVEYLSFLIMYAFLIFVFVFIAEMVPELVPSYRGFTYIYLLLLVLFMGVSFTAYLMKSHFGSLWLMLSAASFLFSEISLFFKLFIIEDYSVNIFFPVFHVFAYYALIEHALNRRHKSRFFQF